jgi:hypothetical protein
MSKSGAEHPSRSPTEPVPCESCECFRSPESFAGPRGIPGSNEIADPSEIRPLFVGLKYSALIFWASLTDIVAGANRTRVRFLILLPLKYESRLIAGDPGIEAEPGVFRAAATQSRPSIAGPEFSLATELRTSLSTARRRRDRRRYQQILLRMLPGQVVPQDNYVMFLVIAN